MKCKGHSCVGLDFMQPGFGFTAVEVGRKRSLKNKGTRNGQLWIWRQVTGQHHNTTMLTKPWNPVSPGNWGQMPRTGWSSWPCWGLDSALAAGLSTEAWAQGRMPTPWKPGMLEHCWCEHTVKAFSLQERISAATRRLWILSGNFVSSTGKTKYHKWIKLSGCSFIFIHTMAVLNKPHPV